MNTLPTWLELLRDRIAREIPGFTTELDATVWKSDLDATRVPILVRILEEVALPAVTVDNWGVRPAVRGVIEALWGGDTGALRRAKAASDIAAWASADTAARVAAWAAAWSASWAAAWTVYTYASVACAASAVYATSAAETADDSTSQTAWRRIADIVIEEVSQ